MNFFDVAVSGGIGAITGGASTALKTREKVGKVGMFVLKHPELVKLGEVAVTSGIDVTGEGWQPVGFDDFGKRVIVGAGTYYGTKALGEVFSKNSPTAELKTNGSIEAANGVEISGINNHGVNRAIGDFNRMGVKPDAIVDALKNPLKINPVVIDHLGRPSQRFIGRFGEVVINPITGIIISVNPTSTSKALKLMKQFGQ